MCPDAWVRVYPETARRHAQAADERLAREGADAPALCGIPLALKDLYGVAGLPVTASSRVLAGSVAAADATAWARLREEGMVLLGHTHTHEFAAGGTTDQVGNPWALHQVVGGSSGGSAAALAAGMVPAALGTDTCGSLRIPNERGHAGGAGDPMIALTALWDMTGMPVACLPVGPHVGVSLIGPRGHEVPLVQAAIDLQEHALGVPVWVP